MENKKIITGIDIGTTKVVAVIAEIIYEDKSTIDNNVKGSIGIILDDMNIPNNNSIKISDNLFISSHIDSLKAIQSNKKCSYKFMMGYSGWSPGQLESEIENGDWVIQETSSDFIFNDDGQMWDIAIGSFGVEISNFSAHGGSA